MSIKIFCDIADVNQIKRFHRKKIVKGFTTNPSLMRKAGAKDYKAYSKQILKVCKNKPISFEVFADNDQSMIEQGSKINTWGKNIYVKVPVVNSKNQFTGKVIQNLNSQNIRLNITAVYSANQTKKILKMINKKKGKNGFGYDPIFIPRGKKLTFAQMKPSKKYKIDHRFKAFRKIKKFF